MESTIAKDKGISICNPYAILERSIEVRNESASWKGYIDPITPRASFVIDELLDLGLEKVLEVDTFPILRRESQNAPLIDTGKSLVNIMAHFKACTKIKDTIIFTAHHDIANPNSENAQDNTASVCNLIALCKELKDAKLNINVLVVLTDLEEFGGYGANRLIERTYHGDFGNVLGVISLELTGLGKNIWTDCVLPPIVSGLIEGEYKKVRTPYNENTNFRHNKILGACIGILPDNEFAQVIGGGFGCRTWALCHSPEDTIDKCSADDMRDFVIHLADVCKSIKYKYQRENL